MILLIHKVNNWFEPILKYFSSTCMFLNLAWLSSKKKESATSFTSVSPRKKMLILFLFRTAQSARIDVIRINEFDCSVHLNKLPTPEAITAASLHPIPRFFCSSVLGSNQQSFRFSGPDSASRKKQEKERCRKKVLILLISRDINHGFTGCWTSGLPGGGWRVIPEGSSRTFISGGSRPAAQKGWLRRDH